MKIDKNKTKLNFDCERQPGEHGPWESRVSPEFIFWRFLFESSRVIELRVRVKQIANVNVF